MTLRTLPLLFAVVMSWLDSLRKRKRADATVELPIFAPTAVETARAAEVPPYVLPTTPLPHRTPGLRLMMEMATARLEGIAPPNHHRAPIELPRVPRGWVAGWVVPA